MDTLVRDPHAPEEARFERPAEAPVRSCSNCGAGLLAGQDWCLECGTAAPGRLGRRPGLRAATTVVALTLALVAGAVTAGYAAINGDAGKDVAKPPVASGAPIAQAPPSTPTAPPAATAPAAPAAPLPKVAPPKTAAPAPAKPVTPAPAATPVPAPAHTTPAATTPHTTPAPSGPQAIDLGADAATLYDPYKRVTDSSDPADAYDDDTTTAWKVTTPADGKEMQTGLLVDLGKKRSIKELALKTSTPGFDVELYAADTAQAPPDILDTRWAHLHNGDNVAKSDSVRLASDSHKYRWVLMWFTVPPKQSPTVQIREFKILG
ncbi:MAG TPA: hypothetical protein VFL73_07370 [Solirubrobacteraceae bacterium]|nr:hypothetical protein [Solirubrobacteraceae bacterium]HET8536985.1 hypothetical protein [Solirubrobacteraceae bacterium]